APHDPAPTRRFTRQPAPGPMMRVLFLAAAPCRPANTGARLRNFHLAKELSAPADVVYMSFADSQPSDRDQHDSSLPFEVVDPPPRGRGCRTADLVWGAVGSTPFSVLNWTRQTMWRALERLLQQRRFDAIQVESIQMAGYLPLLRTAPGDPVVVCDWHN